MNAHVEMDANKQCRVRKPREGTWVSHSQRIRDPQSHQANKSTGQCEKSSHKSRGAEVTQGDSDTVSKLWGPRTAQHQSLFQNKPCAEEKLLTRLRIIKAEKNSHQ